MGKDYTVYMLKLTDGRVYVGMTQQALSKRCRKSGYVHCPAMGKAVEEYGWDSFECTVLSKGLTKSEAEKKEQEYIALLDSTNAAKGFNVALGGNIRGRHSAKTRTKMSDAQKGRIFSDKHLEKLRKPKMHGALRRKVKQYTADGVFVREHDSVADAAKSVNAWKESLIRCCNGKQHTCGGFAWKYGGDTYH